MKLEQNEFDALVSVGYLKPISEYETLYYVGKMGEIVSLYYKGKRKKPKILAGGYDTHGYKIVVLSKGGHQITKRVHRIVAEAFIPNPNNYKEINHIDENPKNCAVWNLEWCSRAYNVNYGKRTEKTQKKVDQYKLDGSFIKTYKGVKVAAEETGTKFQNISACCKGKRKTYKGFLWRWHTD